MSNIIDKVYEVELYLGGRMMFKTYKISGLWDGERWSLIAYSRTQAIRLAGIITGDETEFRKFHSHNCNNVSLSNGFGNELELKVIRNQR